MLWQDAANVRKNHVARGHFDANVAKLKDSFSRARSRIIEDIRRSTPGNLNTNAWLKGEEYRNRSSKL